jgi:hypothetical protein
MIFLKIINKKLKIKKNLIKIKKNNIAAEISLKTGFFNNFYCFVIYLFIKLIEQ